MSAEPITQPQPAVQAAPIEPRHRQFELDMLRGLAVLGILAVNAEAFAWPVWTMIDRGPIDFTTADRWGAWVVDVFFQDRFRTLFSILFGVSIFLVGGDGSAPNRNRLLRRRLLWLLAIGLVHGAVFWWGDILLHYAYCGLIAATCRKWPARRLLWVGGGITAVWGLFSLGGLATGPDAAAAQAEMMAPFLQVVRDLQTGGIAAVQGGWPGGLFENLKAWALMQAMSLFLIPVTVPLMLLGLGLWKVGYFSARMTGVHLLLIGLGGANLALLGWSAWADGGASALDPAAVRSQAIGGFDALVTLGYASLLILLTRFGLRFVTGVFAPVGRMAFTNYLTQTLVMFTLFSAPFGPLLYGQVGPAGLWAYVGAIWAAQLVLSPLWLSVFAFGPFEWAWRCLTYGRLLPIRRAA